MKILFVINTLGSGGKERRITELLKELIHHQAIKFELVIMSNEIHYTEVYDLAIKIHIIIRKTRFDVDIIPRLYKLCKDYRPDIVHCWDSMTAVYSVPVCKLLNIKLVNGMVTNAPKKRNIINKRWLRARLTFPFSDYIVGNSMAGLRAYLTPRHKSKVINNGFNFDRIKNLTPKEVIRKELRITTRYIVGMVASFSANKDYKTYYTAAVSLLNKGADATFIAIGNETDSEDSIKLIKEQNLRSFRLLGKKSDIESYINAMDICVLSTYTEGLSNSVLEYMALGKPVIATDGGGTSELVDNNITGFLIGPSDPAELEKKLDLLIGDHDLQLRMGNAGRERIMNYFSLDQMVARYLDIYLSCKG